ncbi:MAG TPA: (5-formylfuran-3-yl)methyl phosphate synthase [Lacipirellulaceae bacterium]|nr:(5-formylfuran-3-yl)methyl phosphate synthase [Lacipirellulaceae bacterium]
MKLSTTQPGLLVSVRNAEEARAALAGGADVIDVKEPNNGALGAAPADVVSTIVRVVDGRAMVTAALGELLEHSHADHPNNGVPIPQGLSLFKLGLAGCANEIDWQTRWKTIISKFAGGSRSTPPQPVAVVYADWRAARAPDPSNVLKAGVDVGCPALLVDTWDKSSGALFNHWQPKDLRRFIEEVRKHKLIVVLAGSLTGKNLQLAASLKPDFVAVRGAACDGGRRGAVTEERVQKLKATLNS